MRQTPERLKIHYRVESELALREAFAKYHEALGYPKILITRSSFPDYELEDKEGRRIRAEAEHWSSGAKDHGDDLAEECDLVICWYDDWKECPVPRLELSRYIDQPLRFKGFKQEELNILKFTDIFQLVIEKTRDLLKDLEEYVYGRDPKIPFTSSYQAENIVIFPICFIYFNHEKWNYQTVVLRIDFQKKSSEIIGRIRNEIVLKIGMDRWKYLLSKFKTFNFSVRRVAVGGGIQEVIDENAFLEELRETGKVWSVELFRRYDLDELMSSTAEEAVQKIGDDILLALNFIEKEELFVTT